VLVENCRLKHEVEWITARIWRRGLCGAEIPKLVADEKIGHSLVVVALYHFDLWQRGIKNHRRVAASLRRGCHIFQTGLKLGRLGIRDFFDDAEPDAFALRAAPEDEFASGGVERTLALFHGSVNSHRKQRICKPSLFFGIHHLLIRVASASRAGRLMGFIMLVFQRTQIRHHRHGVVVVETKLRHGHMAGLLARSRPVSKNFTACSSVNRAIPQSVWPRRQRASGGPA